MRLIALFLGCALAIAACSGEDDPAESRVADTTTKTATTAVAAPPFNAEIDVDGIMEHAMDPAARAFWAGWGEVYDRAGLHDVSAKSEQDWKKVVDGAAIVVLATNTLMLPAFQRKPEAEWIKRAKDVADLAMRGKEAADRQDKVAIQEIGGQLNAACNACHKAFRTED